jgi:hypothetical protein
MSNITVNVTNAGAANVAVSNGSTVNATVGNGGAVNVSLGTISPGSATVVSGTLTINSTTTLAAGTPAYVKNDAGTAYAAKLDIGIPAGPATSVVVGNTTTLAAGSNATVSGTANGSTLTLAFGIPAGTPGQNGTNGSNGTNGITPTFSASASTLSAGSNATVTATTTNGGANVALAFGIPAGADGGGGGSGNVTLSNATPSSLGTASAGTSSLASRSDHVHALPVIAYANLSGVPSVFPSNIANVSGLQTALDGKQAAGNYLTSAVTSLNNLTGGVTLAAGSNVTLTANGSTLTLSSSGGGIDANGTVDGGDYVGEIPQSMITITQQPTNQTASGGAATFTVAATVSPSGTPTYQWQKQESGAGSFASIAGATSSSLALTGLTNASDNGDVFRVVVSATGAAQVTSNAATLTVTDNAASWAQLGSDIDGEAAGDQSGYAVSASTDGTVVAIGATQNGGTGHVRVYAWNGTSWIKRGADLDNVGGHSVSLNGSGSVVAIGSPSAFSNGGVFVYEWNGTAWVSRGEFVGPTANESFGRSVSLSNSGSVLAVGSPDLSNSVSAAPGSVRVYEWDGTSWGQRGSVINGASGFDATGYSVSISNDGSVVAIGEPQFDGSAADVGRVRVFAWNGTSWTQRGSDIVGQGAGYFLGFAVSISGDGAGLTVGAPYEQGNVGAYGRVQAYLWNGTSWTQRGSDIVGQVSGGIGRVVSLSDSGNVLALGSNSLNNQAGQVRVYEWSGAAWSQRGLSIDGEATGDQSSGQSGFGLAMSGDGTVAAIGAIGNDGNGSNSGHVRVYKWQ